MCLTILVTGGARSGKSSFAEKRTKQLGSSLVYIATSEIIDSEMEKRVAEHQARRGSEWQTLHAPLKLTEALFETDGKGPCLVDCLTIWLNNLIFHNEDTVVVTKELIKVLEKRSDPVVLVTNEVGSGIVPENALARRFRDEAGRMNQIISQVADEVYVSISGIPLQIKSNPKL
ncbi:bifunctional adenosylcobinamide kinase/adenosylcobinamide-phosphate guanylyltransferase [Paracoccaceae bacterium]|nr:bifunctional adenosylcobinamide kinase/adenosylcobinamide-phosphate guanylyltransferase [Paracoccaceae bacterium]